MLPDKKSFRSILITQTIAVICFLVIPALITLLVPRSTVQLSRIDGVATAQVNRHIFFYIPVYSQTISPVLDAGSVIKGTRYVKADRQRNRNASTQIADGTLLLIGDNQEIRVQSTYDGAPVQAEQVQAFIENPASPPITISATAPWALTYLLGGAMTALAALYCFGALIASIQFLVRVGKR